ncbi:MAG: hypothetical protein HRF40_13995 [Nitrososphaera sp.]
MDKIAPINKDIVDTAKECDFDAKVLPQSTKFVTKKKNPQDNNGLSGPYFGIVD